jgi:hypothetical protein
MSKIKTYKGQLPIGEQEKIHLSTNNGLTGYKIKKFEIISDAPGTRTNELVAKIYLTSQASNITSTVDFSDSDLLAVNYQKNVAGENFSAIGNPIIFDKETFNQDIFIYITDASGGTNPANFYLELEQFPIDLNTSTYHTLKNIRSRTQI